MDDETHDFMSPDDHAALALAQAIHFLKAAFAHCGDVHRLDSDGGTLTLHFGPTQIFPDLAIARRKVTISVAVKVEEE